jgi:tRNA threonylcarbamoyladenosine biosynthesis protein TsaB
MKMLALEFSSAHRGVAVALDGEVGSERVETQGTATRVFELIAGVLAAAQTDRAAIDTIAVGLGPGSYTGIRMAISIAQGWEIARPVTVIGLGSVDCLAEEARRAGLRGPVTFVLDAQRQEIYQACYDVGEESARLLEPLHLVGLREWAAPPGPVVSPDVLPGMQDVVRLFPTAATLARLAAKQPLPGPGSPPLEPIYLRATTFVKAPPPRFG